MVDLGCWPGGFLQVASEAVGPTGRVVGVDLQPIEPPLKNENTISIQADLADSRIGERILEALAGCRADLLLCDAAPKLTGARDVDRAAEARLLATVQALVPQLLRAGGDLLVKILEGPEAQQIDRQIRLSFERASTTRSRATRKGSSERYLIARGYLGSAPESSSSREG